MIFGILWVDLIVGYILMLAVLLFLWNRFCKRVMNREMPTPVSQDTKFESSQPTARSNTP